MRPAFPLMMLLLIATILGQRPAHAWERSREWRYDAVVECPSMETMCVLVSCPAAGQPSLEIMLYEHGRSTGQQIELRVDGQVFPLTLPDRNEVDLYRWPLTAQIAAALQEGRSGGIVVDPGSMPAPLSLQGSGASIRGLLARCTGGKGLAPAPQTITAATTAAPAGVLTGLSDDTDCVLATATGVVVDRTLLGGGREIESFHFKDWFGTSYINISLPDAMADKASMHARLLEILTPGRELKIGVQG